jgi:hypothetical protein
VMRPKGGLGDRGTRITPPEECHQGQFRLLAGNFYRAVYSEGNASWLDIKLLAKQCRDPTVAGRHCFFTRRDQFGDADQTGTSLQSMDPPTLPFTPPTEGPICAHKETFRNDCAMLRLVQPYGTIHAVALLTIRRHEISGPLPRCNSAGLHEWALARVYRCDTDRI